LTITQEEADNNLTTKISKNYGVKVNRLGLDLTQNQYDAMVSLCYNLGSVPVSIVNAFKANDMETVKTKWLAYCHAGGKVLQGLVNRRKKELELFNA
jgi:lysozyme